MKGTLNPHPQVSSRTPTRDSIADNDDDDDDYRLHTIYLHISSIQFGSFLSYYNYTLMNLPNLQLNLSSFCPLALGANSSRGSFFKLTSPG